jgi:hypothetical protein
MMMQITIEVPDRLNKRLKPYRNRLPELLERGLYEIEKEPVAEMDDIQAIVSLLASQPTPEQVLAIKPSAEFQARVSELLAQSKAGLLSREGEAELERYLFVEHLVRLAKGRAYEQLG